nr:uncharacterized protein LOC113695764 [Coffea arabica]
MLLLRHGGYLIFDIIHFCELKKQVYLRWTVSLPDLFHQQSSIDPAFLSLHRQTVSSSLSPNFYQDLSNSICFYQPFDSAYPNSLKLPRFVHHFLNAERTPTIVLKTGHNITEVGIKANRLKRNWRKFVLDHHLQHNDTLVFIPESQANFAVLIFDSNGVERFFLGTIFSRCIFMVDEYPLTYLMLNQMYN